MALSLFGTKTHRPLCSNAPCTRRATHTAVAGKLVALVCAICAGQAAVQVPGTRTRELSSYRP